MIKMSRIQNYLDRTVAHYAAIYSGANIPIRGGLVVNESIAIPRGSFPVKVKTGVYWHRSEYDFPEMHEDGTLDVTVYQIVKDRPILSYGLSELVPNKIVRKIKEKGVAWGVGVTATENQWESSAILNVGEYGKTPIIERRDFHRMWGSDKSVLRHIWEMGHNANIPYLLIAPEVRVEEVIEQFLKRYNEEIEVQRQPK